MSLGAHIDALSAFAQSHLTGNANKDAQIKLKLTHSLHVLDNAKEIIDSETINGHDAQLCRLAALYHDIGRFPQFAKYGTFNDRESTNHARLGVLTLRDMAVPGNNSSEDWQVVRFAIAQHNLKTIRPSLPEKLKKPTMVVRDADKIDICRVMIEHFSGENPDPVVTHGFDDVPGKYSKAVYDSVMAEETGDYRLIRCANDFKLLIIGWIYDLHFTSSIKLLARKDYIGQIFSLLPKDDKIQTLEEKINKFMRYKSGAPLDLINTRH